MNGADVLVLALVAAAVAGAVHLLRSGHSGGCGGDCTHCTGCGRRQAPRPHRTSNGKGDTPWQR